MAKVRVARLSQRHPGQTPGIQVLVGAFEVADPRVVDESYLRLQILEGGIIRIQGRDTYIPTDMFSLEFVVQEWKDGEWKISHPLQPES